MREVLESTDIDETRIVTEAAIYADKTAVDEETGLMTVTKWTPGTLPEPDPGPEPGPTVEDLVAENAQLKSQLASLQDTVDTLVLDALGGDGDV